MKLQTATLLAGAFALLLIPSHAQARGPGKGMKRADRMCARLSCSDQQRDEIAQVLRDLQRQQRAAMSRGRALAETIRAELEKARPDEEVILDATEKLGRQHEVLMDARHDAVLALHGLLNARQRAEAAPMLTRLLLSPPRPPGKRGPHGGDGPDASASRTGARGR